MATIKQTVQAIRALGLSCRYISETREFRINLTPENGGTEETACYTDDKQDAIGTATAMVRQTNNVVEVRASGETTDLESKLIRNIAENEFAAGNGAQPETFEDCGAVWSNCLDCGPETIPSRSIPGIMASLVKKGFAQTDGDVVRLTRSGYEAYKAEIR